MFPPCLEVAKLSPGQTCLYNKWAKIGVSRLITRSRTTVLLLTIICPEAILAFLVKTNKQPMTSNKDSRTRIMGTIALIARQIVQTLHAAKVLCLHIKPTRKLQIQQNEVLRPKCQLTANYLKSSTSEESFSLDAIVLRAVWTGADSGAIRLYVPWSRFTTSPYACLVFNQDLEVFLWVWLWIRTFSWFFRARKNMKSFNTE